MIERVKVALQQAAVRPGFMKSGCPPVPGPVPFIKLSKKASQTGLLREQSMNCERLWSQSSQVTTEKHARSSTTRSASSLEETQRRQMCTSSAHKQQVLMSHHPVHQTLAFGRAITASAGTALLQGRKLRREQATTSVALLMSHPPRRHVATLL
jgi:hypothetical protein